MKFNQFTKMNTQNGYSAGVHMGVHIGSIPFYYYYYYYYVKGNR